MSLKDEKDIPARMGSFWPGIVRAVDLDEAGEGGAEPPSGPQRLGDRTGDGPGRSLSPARIRACRRTAGDKVKPGIVCERGLREGVWAGEEGLLKSERVLDKEERSVRGCAVVFESFCATR